MIIYAASIHTGGGKVLLDQLLSEETFGRPVHVICDARYIPPKDLNHQISFHKISPSLPSRWKAELLLKKISVSNPGMAVLCFSNLPPALKLSGKTILYLQNALLLPGVHINQKSLKSFLRTAYEKLWSVLFRRNLDEIWVQTNWMKEALASRSLPVEVRPIRPSLPEVSSSKEKTFDYITVSDMFGHKRLGPLLEAWTHMPDPAPKLLVVANVPEEVAASPVYRSKNIIFKTAATRAEIFEAYLYSRCLILTSKIESYCLPLYEALHFGLEILAPDENYVREACLPDAFITPERPDLMSAQILRHHFQKTNRRPVLKILNVNQTIDPVKSGGTGERTVQMTRALSELGHDCTILTLNLGDTLKRASEVPGAKIIAIPCVNERFYLPWPQLHKISAAVREADMIHVMNHWTLLNVLTYFFIKWHNKNYVVCPAGALPLFGRSRHLKKVFNFVVGQRLIADADAHIIISPDEVGHYRQYGIGTERIISVPNGISPELLTARDDLGFRKQYKLNDAPIVLYVGRINPIKGPDLLVQAFCRLKNKIPHQLVIAGPDEGLRNELEQTIREHGMSERIHFIGHVSGKTKSQAYHAASLMVIPSRQEAMSIVVLEAGVAGLPVVMTDQCGLNSLGELQAGQIVPATVEGIISGLEKSLLSDKTTLVEMGQNLKAFVFKNYLWTSVVKKLEDNYLSILQGRHGN